MKRRVKRIMMSDTLLPSFWREGFHSYRVVSGWTPEDSTILAARVVTQNGYGPCLELTIESRDFPEIEDGADIPVFCPRFTDSPAGTPESD